MFIKVKLPWDVLVPAEDMDTSLMLKRAIVVRLLDAFVSKKATKKLGYFITPTILETVGEGKIKEQTGEAVFPVVFNGICFKMFKGEVLHGVVHKVHKLGVFLRSGSYETIYLSHLKMSGYEFIPGENSIFMDENMSRIEIGTRVRFVVLDTEWREAERDFIALASIDEDNLGPF
ncbi:PREDICTED: DNA-directed RNA polymerase IV subunit 7-like [Camelina sativa]|uniref:DNA-directed RNA polymerase subunit n=1 Tax=Camelina sativa TaxID=90675 RepID=A0ABM0XN04_CAMSA|nr:PREDICTED: DNA-directed RNA polymerase IV subunit 7-like [Camelina sativa]XP_019097085.1 PREDICTED: DNA-directed RNA polymerase IV subunit 7-like [Camelina sativa]